jgi:hypothetical protein
MSARILEFKSKKGGTHHEAHCHVDSGPGRAYGRCDAGRGRQPASDVRPTHAARNVRRVAVVLPGLFILAGVVSILIIPGYTAEQKAYPALGWIALCASRLVDSRPAKTKVHEMPQASRRERRREAA